jgi:nitrate/nitrite transport system permease protein
MAVSSAPPGLVGAEKQAPVWDNENVRAFGLFMLSLGLFLLVWEVGARAGWFVKGVPTASATIKEFWWWVTTPSTATAPTTWASAGIC